MRDNFWVYVDSGGKLPQLRYNPWDSPLYPYYVRYVGNKPVAYRGPLDVVATSTHDGLKFYDYSLKEFVPAEGVLEE
jgi:hypothetical protein